MSQLDPGKPRLECRLLLTIGLLLAVVMIFCHEPRRARDDNVRRQECCR